MGKAKQTSDPATWRSDSGEPIPEGEPLAPTPSAAIPATPAADIDPDREYSSTITSEVGPEGEPVGDIPEGSQYHDEIADTSESTHGASDSAPVIDDVPQAYGWSSASQTEGTHPEVETSGEPILPAPVESEPETETEPEPEPSKRASSTKRAAPRRR